MPVTDRDSDPEAGEVDSWVIPIPNSETPAYAIMPWPLFQRLRALAKGRQAFTAVPRDSARPETGGNEIQLEETPAFDADFDRVVPLPMRAADDLWSKSMDDIAAFDEDEDENALPLDVLERLLDGEHPLKVFRRHRALTQKQLAALTGLNATYLSQIETRKRRGSTRVYRRLATALRVDIGDLIE